MILFSAIVLVPSLGAVLANLSSNRPWLRLVPVTLALELGLSLLQLTLAGTLGTDLPTSLLGLTVSLTPAGSLAILVSTLVVALAVSTGAEAHVTSATVSGGLVGIAGVALISLVGNNLIAMALALGCVVAALLPAIAPPAAAPSLIRAGRRYVTWLILGSAALLMSGILDRFYQRQPGPGILGPVAALFVIGIGMTIAALPLSIWLPGLCLDAPIGAGMVVGILSVAGSSIVAGEIATNPWLFDEASSRIALGAAGGFAGILSAVFALGERNPARSVAFLISANANLALAGLAAAPHADPTGFTWVLSAQALAAALSLSCIGAVNGKLNGLAWRRPALAVSIAVAVVSLIGLPLTAGYVGRWLIASSTVGNHPVLVLETAIASAVGGLAAVRAFGLMVGRIDRRVGDPRVFDVVALAMTAIIVLAGLFPGPILAVLR